MLRKPLLTVFCLLVLSGTVFASCSAPQNPIEAENCLQGTTGWQVSGTGDPRGAHGNPCYNA
jgi:hypothetical protein